VSGVAHHGKPSWVWRRRAVFGVLIGCGATVAAVFVRDVDDGLAQTALSSAFTLAGAVVATYVGGAVWDDIHHHPHDGDGGER